MLKELIEKAGKLEQHGTLLPIGYSKYSEPIKWVVHIYPNQEQIHIEEYNGENRPRPLSPLRTNKIVAYPFGDEGAYVLGIERQKDGTKDERAVQKHKEYQNLLETMARSAYFKAPLLQEAINSISNKLNDGSIKATFSDKEISNKEWITFVYEKENLKNKHLHEIPETKAFWAEMLSENVNSSIQGYCSVCGLEKEIVKNIPTSIKLLGGRRQIASFNDNAFISFRYKKDDAPLGVCLSCATNSAQALNYLIDNNFSWIIYTDKTADGKINYDSTRNQVAVYWLKNDINLSVGEMKYDLLNILQLPLNISMQIPVETTEALINDFLKSPWTGQDDALNLNENVFYLVILSPNGPGRIAIRDWIQVTAKNVRNNLYQYFQALKLIDFKGQKRRPYTIPELLAPLKDIDPNMAKTLVRSAYMGEKPPFSLFQAAINRLRIIATKNEDQKNKIGLGRDETWQRLCAIIKFYLIFGKEESDKMEALNINEQDTAYQSGRLLAVLEEIQRRAATGKLSTTLVERYYGSASTSPVTVLPLLLNMATKAHMPKIRKKNRGYADLENLLEEIMTKIDEEGGFAKTLVLAKQGKFALGFYHQRAELNAERDKHLKK